MSEELEALTELLDSTPDGITKIPMIEEALKFADEEKNLRLQLTLRYTLIFNSVFYKDCIKAIVTFPRYLSLIDENNDKVGKREIYYLLWAFKYILNNGIEFHQISWDKLNALAEEFKKRCIQYGYSLKFYYQIQTRYNMYFKRVEEAKESFNKFKDCKRDEISDCEACELDFEVEYYLFLKQVDEAIKTAKPLLERKKTCGEVPNITYPKLLFHYIKNGDMEEAKKIVDNSYKLIYKNESFLEHLEGHIAYCAITDPDQGISIFTRHLKWALNSRNERHKLRFYTNFWLFWEKERRINNNKEYLLRLPEKMPFYNEDEKYKVDEIVTYCKEQALIIAANFDKRDRVRIASEYIDEIKSVILKIR